MPVMRRWTGVTGDDLGRRLLAVHPRGKQWLQLDVTVANLSVDQLERMGGLVAEPGRAQVREQLIAEISDPELLGRLCSRWVRWSSVFGLPQPEDLTAPPSRILAHPYQLTHTDTLKPVYLGGVLAVFDAALAILAAPIPDSTRIPGAYQQLTRPWRTTCLPCEFSPATAFGPHTQPALAVLRAARTLRPSAVRTIRATRAGIDPEQWDTARAEVTDSAAEWGYPLRSACLFWEAVPAAEDAAGQSPTDAHLVDALWAAAAAQAFTGRLRAATASLLATPWRASGMRLSPDRHRTVVR